VGVRYSEYKYPNGLMENQPSEPSSESLFAVGAKLSVGGLPQTFHPTEVASDSFQFSGVDVFGRRRITRVADVIRECGPRGSGKFAEPHQPLLFFTSGGHQFSVSPHIIPILSLSVASGVNAGTIINIVRFCGDVIGVATLISRWEFCRILPGLVNIVGKFRLEFYLEAKSPGATLVIVTGEERRFAQWLNTIGVIRTNEN
jgi:hypothetical protein